MELQPFFRSKEQLKRSEDGQKIITVDGDELMSQEEYDHFYGNGQRKRDALSDASYYWPGGRVHYYVDPSLASEESDITRAIEAWEQWTCLRFIKVGANSSEYR